MPCTVVITATRSKCSHGFLRQVESSLVPRPTPQLSIACSTSNALFVQAASDNSCGGGLGTRLGGVSAACTDIP